MNIETYGRGERLRLAASLLASLPVKHLTLLPVPSTKDGKFVLNTDIPLSDTLVGVGDGSVVCGYALPGSFSDEAKSLGATVIDLSLDEEYLKYNARLTALGAIGYILGSVKDSLDGMHFGVVGYGRIGSETVRLLLLLGAGVVVFTTRPEVRLMLGELGVDTADSGSLCRGDAVLDGIDVIVNTAPTDISKAFGEGWNSTGKRIIELASGENFLGVDGVERLPSLPEKCYPISAARAYAEGVKRALRL